MMISTHAHPDLLVVGGGVIGLAAARDAAGRGLRVMVLEKGDPEMAASWAAAGMLSPLSEAPRAGPFLEFGLRSLEMYPEWVRELEFESGGSVEYRECGKLRLASTASEVEGLERQALHAESHGLATEWVGPDALQGEAGGLATTVCGGLLVRQDYRVDNRALGSALAEAAARRGVVKKTGAMVAAVVSESDAIRGVRLTDGTLIYAGAVLVAAGAWSGRLEGLPRPLPVRPIRGQMLALAPGHVPSTRVLESADVYLVPRDDGRILVGATVEEAGFAIANTAGGVRRLLDAALRLVPALEGARLAEIWSGLRPGTTDGNPILGPDPEVSGLFYATGHFRNGILLAPATAKLIGGLVAGEVDHSIPEDFFAGRAAARA